MRLRISNQELADLLPKEPGLRAHCRRVAALASEIANTIPLSGDLLSLLEQAALLHHNPSLLFGEEAMDRLLQDVIRTGAWVEGSPRRKHPLEGRLVTLLHAFHAFPRPSPDSRIRTAAEILAVANFLDEHIEFSAWDCNALANLSEVIEDLGGMIQPAVREALRKAFRAGRFSLDTARLPVQIGIVKELLAILGRGPAEVRTLALLASNDPVIAAGLIHAANSALHGRGNIIRSVRQAIVHLGTDASRRLLLALAVRPIFASAGLRAIWRHSLWMAEFFEAFARSRKLMDPEEALFIGLVHDIGRLATQALPPTAGVLFARLSEGGCPVTCSEQLLFGADHAELGAEILSRFQVPEHMIEAVRFHHRPAASSSPLASALYLGEYAGDSEEDLPSTPHLRAALANTQCSFEMLAELTRGGSASLATVLNVA
jgi:putative nucleotidyltransferase with HDIG domain